MRGRTLSQRLLALGGIVVIVTTGVGVLWAAGLIGNQGGGEGIEDVVLSDPVRAAGQTDLEIGAERGQLAIDFEISDFDGGRHKLSDFRGTPVYVNFWATWCVPCQIELPDVKVLADRHGDDLAVITVNRREKLDTAVSYFENLPLEDGSKGVSFTVDGIDPDDTLYDRYVKLLPDPMPVSIFIDGNGVVTDTLYGLITLEMMEEAVAKASGAAVLIR